MACVSRSSSSTCNTLARRLGSFSLNSTQPQIRFISSTSSREAVVKKKAAPAKKKSTVKKKNGPSGPRSAGGKRKGGSGSPTLSISSANPPADLSSLPIFSPENAIESNMFKPMALGEKVRNALKECGSPSGVGKVISSQHRPWLLLRPQTLSVLSHLDSLASTSSTPTSRSSLLPTISGGGSGSSSLLLQSVSYALDSSWLVVYLPRSRTLVDGSSNYVYSSPLKGYLQPTRSREILSSILNINSNEVLKSIDLPQGIDLPPGLGLVEGSSNVNINLETLIKSGLNSNLSPLQSYLYLDLTLRTLANQEKVPYLLAVDEFQSLFQNTRYRDPDYQILKPQDLLIPRLIRGSLATGGALETSSSEKERDLPSLKINRGTALSSISFSDDSFPVKPSLLLALDRALKRSNTNQNQNQNQSSTLIPKVDSSISSNLYHPYHGESQSLEAGMKGGLPIPLTLNSSGNSNSSSGEVDDKVMRKELGLLMDTKEARELWRMRRWEMGYPGYVELANGLTEVESGSDEQFLSKFIETGGNIREFGSALSRSIM